MRPMATVVLTALSGAVAAGLAVLAGLGTVAMALGLIVQVGFAAVDRSQELPALMPMLAGAAAILGFLAASVLFGLAAFQIGRGRRRGPTLVLVGLAVAVPAAVALSAGWWYLGDVDGEDGVGEAGAWILGTVLPLLVPIAAAVATRLPATQRWCVHR